MQSSPAALQCGPQTDVTTPNQPGLPQSRPGLSGTVIAVVAGLLLAMTLACAGLCAGILFLTRTKIESALDRAGVPIPSVLTEPPPTDWNDWMVRRELTHFYQTALESVTTNRALIDKLGDPIETAIDTDELYRRQDTGGLNPSGEHIEFDLQGPKGTGKVAVVSTQRRADGIQPAKITVTLSDGSRVDVPPLYRPLPQVR
jgi:hypothetical protein